MKLIEKWALQEAITERDQARADAVAATTKYDDLRHRIEALRQKWRAQDTKPAGYYHEASAYADGRDEQADMCADELRDALDDAEVAP